jgi:uncharacterized protein YjiK
LFGDPKGVAYKHSEDALYWVSQATPKRVVKARIDPTTNNLVVISNLDVDTLPAADLGDIAFFPRLSQHPFLISQASKIIMEVNVQGSSPVLLSSFAIDPLYDIPRAGGLAFGSVDTRMYIVGKRTSGVPEDDFSVFAPTAPIANLPPAARITRP